MNLDTITDIYLRIRVKWMPNLLWIDASADQFRVRTCHRRGHPGVHCSLRVGWYVNIRNAWKRYFCNCDVTFAPVLQVRVSLPPYNRLKDQEDKAECPDNGQRTTWLYLHLSLIFCTVKKQHRNYTTTRRLGWGHSPLYRVTTGGSMFILIHISFSFLPRLISFTFFVNTNLSHCVHRARHHLEQGKRRGI